MTNVVKWNQLVQWSNRQMVEVTSDRLWQGGCNNTHYLTLVPQSITFTRLCLKDPLNDCWACNPSACLSHLWPLPCRLQSMRLTLWQLDPGGCSCFGGYRCVGTGVGVRGSEGSEVQRQDTGHVTQAAWLDKVTILTIVFVVLNTRVAGCHFTTGFESPIPF